MVCTSEKNSSSFFLQVWIGKDSQGHGNPPSPRRGPLPSRPERHPSCVLPRDSSGTGPLVGESRYLHPQGRVVLLNRCLCQFHTYLGYRTLPTLAGCLLKHVVQPLPSRTGPLAMLRRLVSRSPKVVSFVVSTVLSGSDRVLESLLSLGPGPWNWSWGVLAPLSSSIF